MRWFLPTWNGDFRIESDPSDAKSCRLIMVEPTIGEMDALGKLGAALEKKGWWRPMASGLWRTESAPQKTQEVRICAPLSKVAALMVKVLRPGKQVLTAVRYASGKLETVQGSDLPLVELAKKVEKADAERPAAAPAPAAATVTRPTPSCPQCYVAAVGPATDALLAFMDDEQHEQWAENRYLVCYGGRSGHRYLLAHRHTTVAAKIGRICLDLDDQQVVHFHDRSVPPEEEVLAAKLILETREDWLRNQATMLGLKGRLTGYSDVQRSDGPLNYSITAGDEEFSNPFGDGTDGVPDATFTRAIGGFFQGMQAVDQVLKAVREAQRGKA